MLWPLALPKNWEHKWIKSLQNVMMVPLLIKQRHCNQTCTIIWEIMFGGSKTFAFIFRWILEYNYGIISNSNFDRKFWMFSLILSKCKI